MKYVMIVGDGMGDEPQQELGGLTPLQAAFTPNMSYLASHGQVGLMRTIYPDLPIGSIVANLGILGYDPQRYYPGGRASFEALAHGISLGERDIAFRCNLISLDGRDDISDFTAGQIPTSFAARIFAQIQRPGRDVELFPGTSYRNLLILRNADCESKDIELFEPHTHIGVPYRNILPRGRTPAAEELTRRLSEFIESSRRQIAAMPIRRECKADMLWLWSASYRPSLPRFEDLTTLRAAMVCGIDFLRGIAVATDMRVEAIPGAPAYIDTDYQTKAEYAPRFLREYDLVFVHVNAPDEEGHLHNVLGKVRSIELIDECIVGPIARYLHQNHPGDFRILVLPDHYTRLRDGHHTDDPVPFAVYGRGIKPGKAFEYSEQEAEGLVLLSYTFPKGTCLDAKGLKIWQTSFSRAGLV